MNPNNFLIAMLDIYCEWLNAWLDGEKAQGRFPNDPEFRYEPKQFLVHDPANDLWGQGEIHAVIPTGGSSSWGRVLVEATVSDGDEGGPHDLTAWFDLDTSNGTNPMVAMIQGFDTDLQFVFRDHHLVNLPEGGESE
jgi:hypothetical protein